MKKPVITVPKRSSHDPRWNELGKYARYIADCMGLQEWFFNMSHDAPDLPEFEEEKPLAAIWTGSQTVWAELRVGDGFWKKTPYEQRWAIVHEMLHVVEAPYVQAIREGYEATATAKNLVNQLRERFIDQVSLIISRRFSLPPKGFKKKVVAKPKKKVGHVPHNVSRKRGEADL